MTRVTRSRLFKTRTIRQLADLIRKSGTRHHIEPAASSAIVQIQDKGSRPPLFIIPGLGGSVVNLPNLAGYLGEDQPVYALQPQGLDGQRPFHTRIEDMASYCLQEIRRLQPGGPYYLAGYSFGGFVAFEMAHQIHEQGGQIGLLGLLDTIEWHYLEQIKSTLRLRERLTLYKSRLDQILFGPQRIDYLRRKVVARSSQCIYRLLWALGRPPLQAIGTIEDLNSFAAANYKPRVFSGKLTIFRSVTRSALDGSDQLLGWAGLAAGGIEVFDVPGTHDDMTLEPNARVLAEKIRQSIELSEGVVSKNADPITARVSPVER